MRIQQCYISKSVHDFPFKETYKLIDYTDQDQPCVFFGCYNPEDLETIRTHRGLAVIWWCGQDALTFKDWISLDLPNIFHITERKNVKTYMDWCCVGCTLTAITDLGVKGEPMERGDKIFAYAPKSSPQYHGIKIIEELKGLGYDILIGDGSVIQSEWRAGVLDDYYSQCYIGLVLSPFAGGGASIIEMGLRGIPCITNVMELPNTIKFRDTVDCKYLIDQNRHLIGTKGIALSEMVKESIDYNHNFLNTENYG